MFRAEAVTPANTNQNPGSGLRLFVRVCPWFPVPVEVSTRWDAVATALDIGLSPWEEKLDSIFSGVSVASGPPQREAHWEVSWS